MLMATVDGEIRCISILICIGIVAYVVLTVCGCWRHVRSSCISRLLTADGVNIVIRQLAIVLDGVLIEVLTAVRRRVGICR